jgi:hypothetical protein
MIGGVVIVIGLLFLGAQFMDASSTVSLASEFHIPANHEFTRWATLDRPVRAVVHDIPLGSLLLVVGGGIYWISNWLNEKLHHRDPQKKPHPPQHRLLKLRHRRPSSMIESRDEEINPSDQHWRLTQ